MPSGDHSFKIRDYQSEEAGLTRSSTLFIDASDDIQGVATIKEVITFL